MSSSKYTRGGKKLGHAISHSSISKTDSDDGATEKLKKNDDVSDVSAGTATVAVSGTNPSSGSDGESILSSEKKKKNRKRKKNSQTPSGSPGTAASASALGLTDDASILLSPSEIKKPRDSTSGASLEPPLKRSASSTTPLLRPAYLDEDASATVDAAPRSLGTTDDLLDDASENYDAKESVPYIKRATFVSFTSDSAVVFLPNGSNFSFKGKLRLRRVVNGCLHCQGAVFGKDDVGDGSTPIDMYSPDSTSLLTIEDFNDGAGDVTDEEFGTIMNDLLKGSEMAEKNRVINTLKSAYRDHFVRVDGSTSTGPTVAIFERLDSALCDSLTSFSGQFRLLFAEKGDGKSAKKTCSEIVESKDSAEAVNDTQDTGTDDASIYYVPSISINVFHFSHDDEIEMDPAPTPWQRPTVIPTTHWKVIEQLVDDGGGGAAAAAAAAAAAETQDATAAVGSVSAPRPLKTVVVGGKNCGKSTFARVAINALLSAKTSAGSLVFPNGVFFLDADVGQCEFTPSSFVSLIHVRRPIVGPPFTHLAKFREELAENDAVTPEIVSMAFGGGNSPGTAPSFYMHALKRVHRAYQDHPLVKRRPGGTSGISVPPLIVNTMGWNKGLGISLMVDTLRMISPSHVVQLDSSSATKNFPPITNDFIRLNPGWKSRVDQRRVRNAAAGEVEEGSVGGEMKEDEHKLFSVFSPVGHLALEGSNKYRPPDLRLLALLAHWFQKDASSAVLTASTTSKAAFIPAILSTAPYKIPLRHLTLHVAHSKLKNSQLLYAFNGSLVALGVQTPPSAVAPTMDPDYAGPRFFASNSWAVSSRVEALGLGIVRGVDLDAHHLYLSTFVSPSLLARVDTLFMGDMDLPMEIRQARLPDLQILPTRTIDGGIYCDTTDSKSSVDGEEDGESKPLPYMTADHRTTIGSGGLGNTHKAPFRENKPGSIGRRNDLIRW